MLAVDAVKPPKGGHFDFDVKLDGSRAGAIIEGGRLPLVSRKGMSFGPWFPELADLSADVSSADALLDGEFIAGAGDVESFSALLKWARLSGRSTQNALPVSFVAFDLLWLDGADLTQQPLEERRARLRAIVTETSRIAATRTNRWPPDRGRTTRLTSSATHHVLRDGFPPDAPFGARFHGPQRVITTVCIAAMRSKRYSRKSLRSRPFGVACDPIQLN